VAVVQNREDLLHEGSAPSVIRFTEINANHEDVSRHHLLRLTSFGRDRRRRTPPQIR
jgi:hypothetical protein